MTLKTATLIVIAGLSLNLLIALAESFIFRFFLDTVSLENYYFIMRFVRPLTFHVPLILFFIVLYRKQA